MALAETFGLKFGIGYMFFFWFQQFDMTQVMAWIIMFVVLMLVLEHGVFARLESGRSRGELRFLTNPVAWSGCVVQEVCRPWLMRSCINHDRNCGGRLFGRQHPRGYLRR